MDIKNPEGQIKTQHLPMKGIGDRVKVAELGTRVTDFVKAQPLVAAGVAVIAGYLAASLLGGRSAPERTKAPARGASAS